LLWTGGKCIEGLPDSLKSLSEPAFIVVSPPTLGTLGLYRGVMLLWTGGKCIEGLPDSLKSLSEPAFI
ncbi:hypothetical protein Q6251_33895, partial [Klebsiella quasipneumoniae]|nr:hypothetical protein [Klebsiella quasipneumoniae]